MKDKRSIDRLITRTLGLGLLLGLLFIYFAQERLYQTMLTGSVISLGSENYLRLASVVLILFSVALAIFKANRKYKTSIFTAYLTLLIYIILNYVLTESEPWEPPELMDIKGPGPWLCMGLIFTSYDDKRFRNFRNFLIFSVGFIFVLTVYNLIDFGVGSYRGQALSKYRVYAVNLVWIVPYVFLSLKNDAKLSKLRIPIFLTGVSLALITQTRSFLILYFLVLMFDFYYAKKKGIYIIGASVALIGFLIFTLQSSELSTSFELLSERGVDDTRSDQLSQFLDQLNFLEVVVGEGSEARWSFYGQPYQYLDNQWLLLLWWAGLIPFLMYFYLTAIIPVRMFFRSNDYETKSEALIMILWVLACAGLAIYTTMSVDFFFFIICVIQGRLLYKYSRSI